MHRSLRPLLLLAALLPAAAVAQQSGAGLGPCLGSALGVSGKAWVDQRFAASGAVAFDLTGRNALHLHADYLIHDAQAPQKLAFFRDLGGDGLFLATYGAGVRLRLFGGGRLGVRLPVGLVYAAGRKPWDAFVEVAPILDVVPDSDWDLTAFLGARWYFELPHETPTPVF